MEHRRIDQTTETDHPGSRHATPAAAKALLIILACVFAGAMLAAAAIGTITLLLVELATVFAQ